MQAHLVGGEGEGQQQAEGLEAEVLAQAVLMRAIVQMCLEWQTEWVWSNVWAGHAPKTGRGFG